MGKGFVSEAIQKLALYGYALKGGTPTLREERVIPIHLAATLITGLLSEDMKGAVSSSHSTRAKRPGNQIAGSQGETTCGQPRLFCEPHFCG